MLLRVAELVDQFESWQVLERLRRDHPADLCRAAYALHNNRLAAEEKFGELAQHMLLDDSALQMASAAPVACHRAGRFADGESVADVACGIGGDCMALARRGPVVASDLDETRAWMARHNAACAGVAERLVVLRADASHPASRCDAMFADPARRQASGRRVRHGSDYAPSLEQIAALRPGVGSLAIKISPALDEDEWPAGVDEVEYVSWRGQCREAVLWFGPPAGARRSATIIDGGTLSWDQQAPPTAQVGPADAYLYDPDPAVVRSHLVGLLAQELNAQLLAEQVAYLTAATESPTPFARCFRVLTSVPFGIRGLRQCLDDGGWRPDEILRRRFPVEPDVLRRDLKGAGQSGSRAVSLICTRVAEQAVVFICDPR